MANQSTVTEFLLMGFSNEHDVQILHSVMFLFIYITAVVGNVLIITAVALDHHLHSPMFFFLVNLSVSDICYISTTVPKTIAVSLTNNNVISFPGCVTQVFLVVTFVGVEIALLTVMAYDRYVAICHPLQYRLIMNWDACIQMAAASWISAMVHAILETTMTFRLSFCGSNIVGQFFCNIPQLQKISCSDTKINEILVFVLAFTVNLLCISIILASYVYIFSVVMRIPSVQARHKALSTCTPHLTVFSLFIITAFFSYLRAKSLSSPTVDLVSAVLYTVLPPVLNPIIYSFRNKDIQTAVWIIPQKFKSLIA
ncbi:olfactory receptor 14A16-like [Rhineura floridana]|uniref:olfactory receptor 14A16-like n=1 Tax=Rhineura floridana TaxID=261503 RepID=UPI002AC83384|nr:olfactory receptor 14A16-like [Rhineura floridana]